MAFLKNISSSATDEELVQLYKSNSDTNVVGQLYQRYMELVYGVCLKYLKHPEDAQDSTMMIFEELCKKLLKHEVDNFKGWLYTVSRNHCLMRLRSEKGKKPASFDMAFVQSEEDLHLNGVLEKEAAFQQLEECMGQLAPKQKAAIELFYLQGKCYNEISEITGMEWKEVRSFIQNGRRNLKLCIEKQKEKATLLK